LGPFLASAEMNNPNAAAVVSKVAASAYAADMKAQFGATIFNNPELAFQKSELRLLLLNQPPVLQHLAQNMMQ